MAATAEDEKMGDKILARLRAFADSAEDRDAVVFGEAADLVERLLGVWAVPMSPC